MFVERKKFKRIDSDSDVEEIQNPCVFYCKLVAHIQLIADGQQRYCSVKIKYEESSRQSV